MCASVGAIIKLPSNGGQLLIPWYSLPMSPHLSPLSVSKDNSLPSLDASYHNPSLCPSPPLPPLCGGFCDSCWCRPFNPIPVPIACTTSSQEVALLSLLLPSLQPTPRSSVFSTLFCERILNILTSLRDSNSSLLRLKSPPFEFLLSLRCS